MSASIRLSPVQASIQLKLAESVPGTAAEIEIGTVTTLAEGSSATVANSGTENNAIFDFGIPAGAVPAVGFNFDTATTDSDPGSGDVRFNHATPASVTTIYFDNVDRGGNTVTAWLDSFDDASATVRGTIVITPALTPSAKLIYNATGSVVDGTGYRKVTVTHVAGTTLPSSEAHLAVAFSRAGSDGQDGDMAGPGASVDGEVALYDGTGGALLKRATGTGPARLTSGVLSAGNTSVASEVTGTLPVPNGGSGVASLTEYAPIFGGTTSTGAVQSGAVGTAGQILTSNGAGFIATFQTPTASVTTFASGSLSSTSTDITDIPATYAYLILKIDNASGSVTMAPRVRISTDNGSSYIATAYKGFTINQANTVAQLSSASLSDGPSTNSGDAVDGQIILYGYNSGPFKQAVSSWTSETGPSDLWGLSAYLISTSAINAIRITTVAGTATFDGVTYALYGVV